MVKGDLETFLWLALTGMALSFCFDWYRAMRKRTRPRAFVTALTDLAFWIFSTLFVFSVLLWSNWGEMRFYVFVSLLGGGAFYYQFIGRKARHWIAKMIRIFYLMWQTLLKAVRLFLIQPFWHVLRGITYPIRFFTRQLTRGFGKIEKFFK